MRTGPAPPTACPDGCGTYPTAFTFDNTAECADAGTTYCAGSICQGVHYACAKIGIATWQLYCCF